MNPSIKKLKQQIRLELRTKRKQLTLKQQSQAATYCTANVLSSNAITKANNIALYLQNDAELDTKPLIESLWQQGKNIFLPVIAKTPVNSLRFAPYLPASQMQNNQFGIAEPVSNDSCPIESLHAILLPLVAFNETGQRLGMGGGYYDRTLANYADSKCLKIGIAYEFQKVTELPLESWDQPLDMIITDEAIYRA